MISILFLAIAIFLLSFILMKYLKLKKDFLICLFITVLTFLFFLDMDSSLTSIKSGLELCFNSIIPSIFSFSLICNLLIAFNGIELYSKYLGKILCKPFRLSLNCTFILIASFLCGYPLGAKYSTDAYNKGLISEKEYTRIIHLASNASPVFILGVLGVSMLGDIRFGYIIIASSFISIFLVSLILKPEKVLTNNYRQNLKETPKIGVSLQSSIENAIKTTLTVCGYVIAFSLIINIFKNLEFIKEFFINIESFFKLPEASLYSLFLGSIEVTNGCNMIAQVDLSVYLKVSFMAFFCSFGGLSIIFQTSSFFILEKISFLRYFLIKLVQGIFSFISALILSKLLINSIDTSSFTTTFNFYNYTFYIILIILVIYILLKFKSLFKVS